MRNITISLVSFFFILPSLVSAAPVSTNSPKPTDEPIATSSTSASQSAIIKEQTKQIKENFTQPEKEEEKQQILTLFNKRPAEQLSITNFFAYFVQFAVKNGVPANTVVLILLLPFLASLIAFVRLIIGLPTMEMLVPIILSVTLVATGITAGTILIITILLGSFISKFLLKRVRIMQIPKMSMSLLIISLLVFMSLTLSASFGILQVQQLSIFPILIFILLSDRIVALQLERSLNQTIFITGITISVGLFGYYMLSWNFVRDSLLLYPEYLLILFPINFLIGRYFGLRLTEYFRFASLTKYGNK